MPMNPLQMYAEMNSATKVRDKLLNLANGNEDLIKSANELYNLLTSLAAYKMNLQSTIIQMPGQAVATPTGPGIVSGVSSAVKF